MNYVVTCWSGIRRFMEDAYTKDRTHFLKIQIAQLKKHKSHDLSQITFVINHNPDEDENYKQFVNNIPKEINGIPIEVLRRENKGRMFGVWFHVCKTYGNKFDHYFVTEDDYAPVSDDFVEPFLSAFKKEKKCGFMCPKIIRHTNNVNVPLFVIGVISSECLVSLFEKHNNLLCIEIGYEEIDRGLIFYTMNEENYSINQLRNYSNYCLMHECLEEKHCHFKRYGNGPLLFAPTLYIERQKITDMCSRLIC